MGKTIGTIKDNDFRRMVLESDKPAVVDFWAQWCVPCKQLDTVLQEMALEYEGKVSFFKVDVNESNMTASRYAVRSLPMLLFFEGGEIVDQAVGSLSREVLVDKLNRLLESS
ncbi:MAG TPA: thioredoxin [Patescibacteria group bacterium]|nr:thioredoxin [Patescibacteria group bacterium]